MTDPSRIRTLLASLRALAEPIAERLGCELVAIELIGGPSGRRAVRVSVDRPGGASVEDCARVSRALSPALDAEDLVDGAYDLEVSTPGIERPVQRERDFAYFAGCDVRIKLFGQDGRRRLKATLLGCVDGRVRVRAEDGEREIPLSDIERANLVLDLDQYARLGQGLHPIAEGEKP